MRAEPIAETDLEWGHRCDHDQCREYATHHCACLCGRVLCAEHEFEERRAFQVRQGLARIAHGEDRARVLAMREDRRMEILRG